MRSRSRTFTDVRELQRQLRDAGLAIDARGR